MPTDESILENWSEFAQYVEHFVPRQGNPYGSRGFRGQERNSSTWRLQPSIARQLPSNCKFEAALRSERLLLDEFRQDGDRNLPHWEIPDPRNPYQLLGWLATMQQYGAPTRLLDWTFSPYVAAYFAVRAAPEADGALWMYEDPGLLKALHAPPKTEVSLKSIEGALAGNVPKLSDPPGICPMIMRAKRLERMYAQQGFYLVCEDPRRAHDEVMDELAKKPDAKPFLHKMVISSAAKMEFLAHLRMMNITGASLYPGADGLGRHVAEFGRLVARGLATTPAYVQAGQVRQAAEDSG